MLKPHFSKLHFSQSDSWMTVLNAQPWRTHSHNWEGVCFCFYTHFFTQCYRPCDWCRKRRNTRNGEISETTITNVNGTISCGIVTRKSWLRCHLQTIQRCQLQWVRYLLYFSRKKKNIPMNTNHNSMVTSSITLY